MKGLIYEETESGYAIKDKWGLLRLGFWTPYECEVEGHDVKNAPIVVIIN